MGSIVHGLNISTVYTPRLSVGRGATESKESVQETTILKQWGKYKNQQDYATLGRLSFRYIYIIIDSK